MAPNTRPEEIAAREFLDFLKGELPWLEAKVDGRGVHWHVDVRGPVRGCRIHVFWYDSDANVLVLGIQGNAHISKVNVGPRPSARQGAEYLVTFEHGDDSPTGRAQERRAVARAVAEWVTGITIADLYDKHAWVDAELRALSTLAESVNTYLAARGGAARAQRSEGYSREHGELWVYAGARSCRLVPDGSQAGCALLLHRTQLARIEAAAVTDVAEVVRRWVEEESSLASLRASFGALDIAPFAELFERGEAARWHWCNVLREARSERESGGGVLAFYLPLIEALLQHPSLSSLFSFTSLNRLCLSWSSQYPFVTTGLPIVSPSPPGALGLYTASLGAEVVQGDADTVCAFVEKLIEHSKIKPFVGNDDDLLLPLVNEELARQGSELRARIVQRLQWSDLVVASANRLCIVSCLLGEHRLVLFEDKRRLRDLGFADLAAAIDAARRWLRGEPEDHRGAGAIG